MLQQWQTATKQMQEVSKFTLFYSLLLEKTKPVKKKKKTPKQKTAKGSIARYDNLSDEHMEYLTISLFVIEMQQVLSRKQVQVANFDETEKSARTQVQTNVGQALDEFGQSTWWDICTQGLDAPEDALGEMLKSAETIAARLQDEQENLLRQLEQRATERKKALQSLDPGGPIKTERALVTEAGVQCRALKEKWQEDLARAHDAEALLSMDLEEQEEKLKRQEMEYQRAAAEISELEESIALLIETHKRARAPLEQEYDQAEHLAREMRTLKPMEERLRSEIARLEAERSSLEATAMPMDDIPEETNNYTNRTSTKTAGSNEYMYW